jgi:Dehydrogenases with different specificities (related to short-chain alcohol dehydrogenases)
MVMKTAIITGGAHGIGKGIAEKLLSKNMQVIILDNNESYIKALPENKLLFPFLCDVGNPEEVEKKIATITADFPQIDYLINNAGISEFKEIKDLNIEEWNRIISVNLSSVFYMVKNTLPYFSEKSAVINIASTRALMSEANTEAYSASKGGIVALTHALAISLGPKVRVNCISPGWIEVNGYDKLSQEDHLQHPSGRVGYIEDIAEAVEFLLSEKAGFITGQNIVIDGGMTKKMIYVE